MPDIVDELRSAKACTQKTFMHMPDWKDGRRILLAAAAEIERLRAELAPRT